MKSGDVCAFDGKGECQCSVRRLLVVRFISGARGLRGNVHACPRPMRRLRMSCGAMAPRGSTGPGLKRLREASPRGLDEGLGLERPGVTPEQAVPLRSSRRSAERGAPRPAVGEQVRASRMSALMDDGGSADGTVNAELRKPEALPMVALRITR